MADIQDVSTSTVGRKVTF